MAGRWLCRNSRTCESSVASFDGSVDTRGGWSSLARKGSAKPSWLSPVARAALRSLRTIAFGLAPGKDSELNHDF